MVLCASECVNLLIFDGTLYVPCETKNCGNKLTYSAVFSNRCSVLACTVLHYPTRANTNACPHSCMLVGLYSICYMMYCTSQGCTVMGTTFVYTPYASWKMGAHRNAIPDLLGDRWEEKALCNFTFRCISRQNKKFKKCSGFSLRFLNVHGKTRDYEEFKLHSCRGSHFYLIIVPISKEIPFKLFQFKSVRRKYAQLYDATPKPIILCSWMLCNGCNFSPFPKNIPHFRITSKKTKKLLEFYKILKYLSNNATFKSCSSMYYISIDFRPSMPT